MHADDRRQHADRILTYVACMHDEYPAFRLDQARTSLGVAHPLASAYAPLLDQGQHQT